MRKRLATFAWFASIVIFAATALYGLVHPRSDMVLRGFLVGILIVLAGMTLDRLPTRRRK